MSATCATCATVNVPGAMLCAGCSSPLAVAPPVASVLPFPAVGSAGAMAAGSALAVLERGAPCGRVIELPRGDFALSLGRHDLVASPPVVVDVDLTEFCAPIALPGGARGYAVSRRHCVLTRDRGALALVPGAGAPTLVRAPGAAEFEPAAAGQPRALAVGARIVFGAQSPLIVEVV